MEKNTSLLNQLKGVVTPFSQKYHRSDSSGFELEEIVNGDMIKRFKKDTFPKVEKMSNGNLFIQPTKHVMSTTENYYVKWLVLDSSYQPTHNHDYPMVELPKNGYIVRISVPITPEKTPQFMINYVIDYHNIQIDSMNSLGNVEQDQSPYQAIREETVVVRFNINEHLPLLNLISNREEFFSKYLNDIYN